MKIIVILIFTFLALAFISFATVIVLSYTHYVSNIIPDLLCTGWFCLFISVILLIAHKFTND